MSKLAKLIKAECTGRRFSTLGTINDLVNIEDGYISIPFGTEYSIKAVFGAKLCVTEEAQASSNTLPLAVEKVQRAVSEAVFGEFREPFKAIQIAIWERKYDKAEMLLSKLESQMFSDE